MIEKLRVPEKLLGKFCIYCSKCGKGSQRVRKTIPNEKNCKNCGTRLSIYLVSNDGLVYPELQSQQSVSRVSNN